MTWWMWLLGGFALGVYATTQFVLWMYGR